MADHHETNSRAEADMISPSMVYGERRASLCHVSAVWDREEREKLDPEENMHVLTFLKLARGR